MLGATLTKDEVDEFMREADVVSTYSIYLGKLVKTISYCRMGMESWTMMSLSR
jgi:hypothetical protein